MDTIITNNQEIQDRRKIRESMIKFGSAMKELVDKTGAQTKVLTSMLNNQVKEAYEKRRQERFESIKKNEEDKKKDDNSYFSVAKEKFQDVKSKMGDFEGLTSLIFGRALRGAGLLALVPVVSKTAQNLIASVLEKIGASEDLVDAVSSSVSESAAWGLGIAAIFNKKIGIAFAAGSVIWNIIDKKLDIQKYIQSMAETVASPELSKIIANGAGTTIISGLIIAAPFLIKKSLGLAFKGLMHSGGLIKDISLAIAPALGTALVSAVKMGAPLALRVLPLAAAAGISILYEKYGEYAASWLSEQSGMSPDWAKATIQGVSWAATGASLGMMFGPHGMIAGAVVGLVASLGYSIWKWFKGRREEAIKAAEEEQEKIKKSFKDLNTSANPETGFRDSVSRYVDADRVVNDSTSYSSAKKLGEETSPMELVVPTIDTDANERRNLELTADSLSSSINKLIEGYDGSEASKKEISQALHSLYALKSEIDEKTAANNGFMPKELSRLNNALKFSGTRLRKFVEEKIPGIIETEFFDMPKFRKGTKGFQDFGTESIALLHGKEAVVPDNTDAASILKKFFNEDWSIRKESIMNSGNTRTKMDFVKQIPETGKNGTFVYSPTTVAPTNTIVGGSSVNNSRITTIGGSASDLDFGLPRSAI